MVYEFVWELKGRHLILSCGALMEVMVGYIGVRVTKGEKSWLEQENLPKIGF